MKWPGGPRGSMPKIVSGLHSKEPSLAHAIKFDLATNLRNRSSIGLKIAPELLKKGR